MANLANVQPLKYCGCKSSNTSSCSNIATYQVTLRKRKEFDKNPMELQYDYRCEEHKNKGTTSKKIHEANEFDQGFSLQKINDFLKTLIGKNIHSKFHTARELRVKYLKENGGVMCFQEHSKKWKYVFYNQIDVVL